MVAEPYSRKEGAVGQLAAEWLCTPTSRFVHAAKLNSDTSGLFSSTYKVCNLCKPIYQTVDGS
jgi:hypothetical protein